jgi:chromosome segregation ATPase
VSVSSASSAEDTANNIVIQSEMRSLRKALAELTVATSCNVGPSPPDTADASDRRSERLLELEAHVNRLTLENEQFDAANRSLRSETNRLSELLHQHDEGGAAETEILRRRLGSAESRLEGLQAALAAALHQYEGNIRSLIDEECHSHDSHRTMLPQSVGSCWPRNSAK